VTRAKRRNVTVKEIKNYEDFIDFRKLMKIWGKTKGIDISEQNELIEKDWKLYKKGVQHFFLAFQENEVISGLRIGTFNGIAYTHQVLNTYSQSTSLGGSLLTWHAIEWSKNNNMRIYDFSGVKSPPKDNTDLKKYNEQWKGLTEYKKKWGGYELEYHHLIKTRKGTMYKLFRLLSRPDFLYREYKRKHFHKPLKSKINTR
jgi:lipid II:glycine glycyltransferase (peptidoglycan interpeptide bridge formation enzyme)